MKPRMLMASVFALIAMRVWAGGPTDHWIFGENAWLHFPNSVNPTAASGAVISTEEGSAVMSNAAGQLQLYTDGRVVMNRLHAPMPNGSSLLGGSSATQSALIVPRPAGPGVQPCRFHYLFTVEEMSPNVAQAKKMSYSLIDMNLDAFKGDIVTGSKNIPLVMGVAEKLAATRHGNGTDYFVVSHGFGTTATDNVFYRFRVTSSGVIALPPVSVGSAHPSTTWQSSAGQMEFSPDGSLLAVAVNTAFVEIFRFNRMTGAITGPILTTPASGTGSPFGKSSVYGLEFSPNSQRLYVSTLQNPSALYQLNIGSSTWTHLITSTVTSSSANPNGYEYGQLKLGPDNKIYVAQDFKYAIGVIDFPDNPGLTSLNNNALGSVSLGTGQSRLGLPTTIAGAFSCCPAGTPPQPVLIPPLLNNATCNSGVYTVTPIAGTTYTWTVTNGTGVTSGVGGSTFTVTWTNPASPGTVSVTATLSNGCPATATMNVPRCPPIEPCCKEVSLQATATDTLVWSGSVGTFTPMLSSSMNPITKVSATIVSASHISSPSSCGTSGPMIAYVAGAAPVNGTVPLISPTNGQQAVWNFVPATVLSTPTAFPISIQFPPAATGSNCSEALTICVEYRFTDSHCRTCSILRCYTFHRGWSS